VQALDKRRPRGGDHTSAEGKANFPHEKIAPSHVETAKTVGASEGKIKKARAVLDHAPEEVKAAVLDGTKSINAALCFGMAPFFLPGGLSQRPLTSPQVCSRDYADAVDSIMRDLFAARER